jgi:hypothetical protein
MFFGCSHPQNVMLDIMTLSDNKNPHPFSLNEIHKVGWPVADGLAVLPCRSQFCD